MVATKLAMFFVYIKKPPPQRLVELRTLIWEPRSSRNGVRGTDISVPFARLQPATAVYADVRTPMR